MLILNSFSQTPTRNFTAAGIDFFIPNVKDDDSRVDIAWEAIKKSYKITDEDIKKIVDLLKIFIIPEYLNNNIFNIIHLYFGLNDKERYMMSKDKTKSIHHIVKYFVNNVLTFDENKNPGIICKFSDMLFINSGIKVALQPTTSLEFKNKSGKGVSGWSVKACLVDEDYSGYMHLSMQYLWWDDKKGTVYVGDKITQGTIQNVLTDDAVEIESEDEYNEIMKNSQRGGNGFGSSDVKH